MIELHSPCVITSRLCAGLHVRDSNGLCEISIEHSPIGHRGKPLWRWHLDLPNGEHHTGDDLAGWGDERAMLGTLCSFLTAPDNLDLFPPAVAEWAYCHSDELTMLGLELEES